MIVSRPASRRTGLRVASSNMRWGNPGPDLEDMSVAPPVPPSNAWTNRMSDLGADVLLVQEVMEAHVPGLQEALGTPYVYFTPMHHMEVAPGELNRLGLAIFSRTPIERPHAVYYAGFNDHPKLQHERFGFDFGGRLMSAAAQQVTVVVNGVVYYLANTHFTWTPGGEYTFLQEAALNRLLANFSPSGPLIPKGLLCADWNMPRTKSAGWDRLGEAGWIDCVPPEVTTSLDPVNHAAAQKGIELMLDGVHVRSPYKVSHMQQIAGVSDHQGWSFRFRLAD